MKYVIIGNSAAAIGTVEGIRQIDRDGPITIISNEPYHTYSRPLISYLLYGKTDLERMKYRPDDFYEKNNVTPLLGETVVQILPDKKQVALKSGKTVDYDKLMVATGSRPFVPPMEGLDQVEQKFSFMTLDDAKALEQAITPKSRVLIIGAGLIGLKCAEGIRDRVAEMTVIDLAPRILPSILDERGSAIVQKHIEGHGVRFILGDSVAKFQGKTAKLQSGKTVSFDILVVAVGVRPNTELVSEAGGKVDRGILVDDHMETTLRDIYSAGDCVVSQDIAAGMPRILAILPNAYMQGECAGINMAGGNKAFGKAIPMNAMGVFGLHMVTAGSYEGEEYVSESEGTYKKLVTKDGLLKGYIIIGDVARAGIYTSLIREKTPLDAIDFELIREKPQLMAFSRKDRAAVLSRHV